jgi:hypothetical protein
MFESLEQYPTILVTGPHRSGTTLAAECIAVDTGHAFIPEEHFECDNLSKFQQILTKRQNIVVQCPAVFRLVLEITGFRMLKICMWRSIREIKASMQRMYQRSGKHLDGYIANEKNLAKWGLTEGFIADVIYEKWFDWVASGKAHNYMLLPYEHLKHHRLWVAEKIRRDLGKEWHNRRIYL